MASGRRYLKPRRGGNASFAPSADSIPGWAAPFLEGARKPCPPPEGLPADLSELRPAHLAVAALRRLAGKNEMPRAAGMTEESIQRILRREAWWTGLADGHRGGESPIFYSCIEAYIAGWVLGREAAEAGMSGGARRSGGPGRLTEIGDRMCDDVRNQPKGEWK